MLSLFLPQKRGRLAEITGREVTQQALGKSICCWGDRIQRSGGPFQFCGFVAFPKQKNCLWNRNQFTFDCCDLGFKQVAYVVSCISHLGEITIVGRGRNALGKQARQLGEVTGVKQHGEKSGSRDWKEKKKHKYTQPEGKRQTLKT